MQVIEGDGCTALCHGRNGEERLTMLMVGEQAPGTWVLGFLGWAREVISAEDAHHIDLALDGLSAIMGGAESIDLARHFPGLGPAPELS